MRYSDNDNDIKLSQEEGLRNQIWPSFPGIILDPGRSESLVYLTTLPLNFFT